MSLAGDEGVGGEHVAQGVLDGFGDADSGTFENSSWFEIILRNVEVGLSRRSHVFAVVAESRDGEGLGEASGPGGE